MGLPSPSTTLPSPKQLRRKAPFETIQELTHVQRLVEYFVVVSCQACSSSLQGSPSTTPRAARSPMSKRRSFLRKKQDSATRFANEGLGSKEYSQEHIVTPEQRGGSPCSLNITPVSDSAAGSKRSSNINQATKGNIHLLDNGSDHTFRPAITSRYPLKDHADDPLNPLILQFCLPAGDVVVPSKTYELPRVHHFVLTNERGRKIYGTCLTVFEEFVPSGNCPWNKHSVTEEDESIEGVELSVCYSQRKSLYLPKVICLLSTWPYLTAFREYLSQLYRLAVSTNIMPAPIERYVTNLCEIPAPPPGVYEVQVNILDSTIRFWAPPAKLPIAYTSLPYQVIFECLEIENVLRLWGALLMERKILLVSSQYSILTVCAEILCSLLFPLRWSHLYIPLLPQMLCPILDAPVPYLCGIVRENWLIAQAHVPEDTIVVDLDCNSVVFGDAVPPTPVLPAKKFLKLKSCLTETVGHIFWRARGIQNEYRDEMNKKPSKRTFNKLRKNSREWTEKLAGLDHAFNLAYTPDSPNLLSDTLPEDERYQWDLVQSAFLRFFTAVFKEYRKFLPSTTGSYCSSKLRFDVVGFLTSQKSERSDFLTELCATQQFDDLLTRRMYSPGEPDLMFFDQSIDAKLNRSKLKLRKEPTPLLQSAKVHKVLKILKAVDVNVEGLSEGSKFVYDKWPDTLDVNLFSVPRPVPKIIAAEFDRQSALVAKLRAIDIEDNQENVDFFGGDFDESHEVASFTVFLFVYSALVGRDWQEYKRRRSETLKARYLAAAASEKENEERIEVKTGATVLSEAEKVEAVNGCVQDLSFGLCDSCPYDTLIYIWYILDHAYTAFFERSNKHDAELHLQFNAAAMKLNEEPIGAEDDLIEFEEAKEIAGAQLDLAFEILKTMSIRGLSTDSDAYRSVMEACGRCGDTQRALNVIELMRCDGFAADGDFLACFIAAFAQEGAADDDSTEIPADVDGFKGNSTDMNTDTQSKFLKKNPANHRNIQIISSTRTGLNPSPLFDWKQSKDSNFISNPHDIDMDSGPTCSTVSSMEIMTEKVPFRSSAFTEWIPHRQDTKNGVQVKEKRRRRQQLFKHSGVFSEALPVTDFVTHQLDLSETLLDVLYPYLKFDTTDCCPHCSHELTESDVVAGWSPCNFTDYTAACPKCKHRFVPRFTVSSSSRDFLGSQGPQTPLYCEYLSPWVIRKELQRIVKSDKGVKNMLDPSWRHGTGIEATIFWNLLLMCRRNRLPFSFLLQGSFEQSRLVLPRMPIDMH